MSRQLTSPIVGVALLIVITSALAVVPLAQAAGDTDVSVTPSNQTIDTNGTATVDIVVQNASDGIRSYNVSLTTTENSPIAFENATLAGEPGFQSVTVVPDGTRITMTAAAANTSDSGEVTVATVALQGTRRGNATISATVEALGDENNDPYTIGNLSTASVAIRGGSGPPAIVGGRAPTDVDNDGVYEDINGDGNVSMSDVQAMFVNRDTDAVRQQRTAFDFTSDGNVNIVDIQRLFVDVQGRPA